MIRVLLADDQVLLRSGLRSLLDAEADIEVVGEAGDGEEAERLTIELEPDVVLMDIRMPGVDASPPPAPSPRTSGSQLCTS